MIDKVLNKVCRAYLKARNKFMELANEESGMETVEVVILIAIAAAIAVAILNILTKDAFPAPDGSGDKTGLLGWLFGSIAEKLKALFDDRSISPT